MTEHSANVSKAVKPHEPLKNSRWRVGMNRPHGNAPGVVANIGGAENTILGGLQRNSSTLRHGGGWPPSGKKLTLVVYDPTAINGRKTICTFNVTAHEQGTSLLIPEFLLPAALWQ